MNKPELSYEEYEMLIKVGMNKLYKEFAEKGIYASQIIDGKIVSEIPSKDSIHESFRYTD